MQDDESTEKVNFRDTKQLQNNNIQYTNIP